MSTVLFFPLAVCSLKPHFSSRWRHLPTARSWFWRWLVASISHSRYNCMFIWGRRPHKWEIEGRCWKIPEFRSETFIQTTAMKRIQLGRCMFLFSSSTHGFIMLVWVLWTFTDKIFAHHPHTHQPFAIAFLLYIIVCLAGRERKSHSLECSPFIIMSSLLDSWDKWETPRGDMNSKMHFCLSARADCSCNLYLLWGL